jgi:group I intron endonuclease
MNSEFSCSLLKTDYKKAGVYKITKDGECIYVGSSSSLWSRFLAHRRILRKGTHHCRALQSVWNTSGESTFSFEILEFCEKNKEVILSTEQRWIDFFGHENLCNACSVAGSSLGTIHSYEVRTKFSSSKGGYGVVGVTPFKNGTWRALIKGKFLGTFATKEEAVSVAKEYEETGCIEKRPYFNNTSGYAGVSFFKPKNRWIAKYTCNKRTFQIGYFKTPEEANEARLKFIDKFHELDV